MSRHTKGPWEIVEHNWAATSIYGEGRQIAHLEIEEDERDRSICEPEMDANAALIAKAPDMHDALHAVLLFFNPLAWDNDAQQEWERITGAKTCTSRDLCDTVRKALGVEEKADG